MRTNINNDPGYVWDIYVGAQTPSDFAGDLRGDALRAEVERYSAWAVESLGPSLRDAATVAAALCAYLAAHDLLTKATPAARTEAS